MESQTFGLVVGIAVGLLLFAIIVVIFRWLWYSTIPDVFGIREVSFWQAVKILLLAGILFGGHRAMKVPQQVMAGTGSQTVKAE
ncbi:MAG: hypothetical protein GY792_11105 [Gammaproteobacteria bacterium]|nr:hypothetical protein [Gammaproteobacteria bacterium]